MGKISIQEKDESKRNRIGDDVINKKLQGNGSLREGRGKEDTK